jgi:hypothetical protein
LSDVHQVTKPENASASISPYNWICISHARTIIQAFHPAFFRCHAFIHCPNLWVWQINVIMLYKSIFILAVQRCPPNAPVRPVCPYPFTLVFLARICLNTHILGSFRWCTCHKHRIVHSYRSYLLVHLSTLSNY